MQRRHYQATSSGTRSSCPDERQYYCLPGLEVTSGRIRGFRSNHIKACELAKQLEASLHDGIVSSPG